ncbi:MAG TPA: FAD-dependent oxidoreductase [Coriobacteriia bacterium]|nr:FAD-dependent oxidoreductase [Coriobacteriia bacterium]
MADCDFDAIVVGAGCAGSVAAYELAKAGKSVLVVERGNSAGAKNMTGGRLYAHALKEVFPDCYTEAPFERRITHERISMMTPNSNMTIDFGSTEMEVAGQESYSVLRADFDPWLAGKAEDAGAEFIYGIAVESLLMEDGRVKGIKAGEDEITAEVVLLCDGVNSLLTEAAVGYKRPDASQIAVGIKQVIALPAGTIEDRVLAAEGDGAAWLFVGDCTRGRVGGGFMYTNKESISLGLVATISDVAAGPVPVYQMLEDFKNHPSVAPLIKGGKVVEHSGHMVPEGGLSMMPPLCADGVLIAGESAMMCLNLGYMVRGMDFAIAAGQHAGRTAAEALAAGDTSKVALASYQKALEENFVLKDLRQFSKFPHFMENCTRLFNEYPVLTRELMNGMFIVDGSPMKPLKQQGLAAVKNVGIFNLVGDAMKGMKAL